VTETKLFTPGDFAGVDMSDRAGKTTGTRFGPLPGQAENIATEANARLSPLVEALEVLQKHIDHNFGQPDWSKHEVDVVLSEFRKLKERG
jgi:hypothetical protein